MRLLIQRVTEASVLVENNEIAAIKQGLLVLIGIENEDNSEDISWLVSKLSKLRIFDDENGVMNRSVTDVDGDVLLISQFTLHASTKKGNRPSYIKAAHPKKAIPLYEEFHKNLEKTLNKDVPTGKFGAEMQVRLINDGPVSIWIDSKNKE